MYVCVCVCTHVSHPIAEGTVVEGEECGMDNRDIVDDGSAQSLKECDIIRLRTQARGQVSRLVCAGSFKRLVSCIRMWWEQWLSTVHPSRSRQNTLRKSTSLRKRKSWFRS